MTGVDPGYVTESHSMNENGIYTFRGFNGPAMALISVDVSNASVIHMNNTTDNATGFEEPTCLLMPTAVNEVNTLNILSTYPNPKSITFTI